MIDRSESGMAYNRFRNLESIEDRIIYYLLSPTNKSPEELRWVHTIWKLLMYNDIDALNKPLPKYSDVIKLIQNDNISQADKRIFRSPHLEEGWEEQCSMLKIYVDTIIPKNHIWSIVNIGIDVLCHDKIINVKAEEGYEGSLIDEADGIKIKVETMSRVTLLSKAVLYLLNGAEVQGLGQLQFNAERSRYNLAQYGLWNKRNFEGMKIVISGMISGAS